MSSIRRARIRFPAALALVLVLYCGCPVAAAEQGPAEQRVLERFLGAWETQATIHNLTPTTGEHTTHGKGVCRATLLGRYFEFCTESDSNRQADLQVMTYDSQIRVFRQWVFSSDGYYHEAQGAWNASTATLRWEGKTDRGSFVVEDHWVSPDRLDWTLRRTDAKGNVTRVIDGSLRRVKAATENK